MCPDNSFPTEEDKGPYAYTGTWMCQACNSSIGAQPWTMAQWIFSTKPNIFGLIPGTANPTGVALMIILAVMFVCSLPFIRRRGHFEIFWYTHNLYWAYFVLLVIHAPQYWMWLILPGVIWIFETAYRTIHYIFGAGKTVIKAGVILHSKLTNLIIDRPPGCNFCAGD